MANIDSLKAAGLSEKEANAYLDLKLNGESRTGKICERTKIPSSQIYSILTSLMEKGLVSYKLVNNVKVFDASEPEMLARLFEEKEEEIKKEKAELLGFISQLKIAPKKAERLADFKYFQGIRGIKSLYEELISSWKPGDEYCIASAPLESFRKLEGFFLDVVHKKRIKDKVRLKILINKNSETYGVARKEMPYTEVRFIDIDTKTEYGVLNDYFFLVNYDIEPYALLIKDKEFAGTFRIFFNILWNQGRKIKRPQLVFSGNSLRGILRALTKKRILLLADPHNYPIIKNMADSVCVENTSYEQIEPIKKRISENKYSMIVGIGGCSALDIARACASEEIKLILIPTLLSTVCISVDKAVINYNGEDRVLQTIVPDRIIISLPALMKTEYKELVRWSQSGFGDLFAKIGASIDVVFRETEKKGGALSLDKVKKNVPETFEALDWVAGSFTGYNRKGLKKLAEFLHHASVAIIVRGGFELSGGGEHELCYAITKQQKEHAKVWPTHGQLVSVGTLIEARLFWEVTGDRVLYEKLHKAYEKLQLPLTYRELERTGIKREYLIQGLQAIKGMNNFLSRHADKAISLLDDIFLKKGGRDDENKA